MAELLKIQNANFQDVMNRAAESIKQATEMLERDVSPPAQKVRLLKSRMCTHLELLNEFKPNKGKEDVFQFHELAQPIIFTLRERVGELETLIVVPTTSRQSSTAQPSANHIRAPEISVPIFNGEPEAFPAWREAMEIALDHPGMTKKHKFLFYREKLGQKARARIDNIEITDDNFDVAKSKIEEYYGNKGKLVQHLFTKLMTIPPANASTASLRHTVDDVESTLRALELQHQDLDNEVIPRNIVFAKFPPEVLFALQLGKTPKLSNARVRLEEYVSMREEISAHQTPTLPEYSLPPISSPVSTMVAAAPQAQSSTTPTSKIVPQHHQKPCYSKCPFCKGEHFADSCTKYPTAKERAAQMGEKFCLLCLRTSHTKKTCEVKTKGCYHCKKQKCHNSAFCPTKYGLIKDTAPNDETKHTHAKVICLSSSRQDTYLLAVVSAQNPITKHTYQARIMLDTAAGQTYVRNSLAQRLNLEMDTPQLEPVGKFGTQQIEYIATHTVRFAIEGVNKVFTAKTTPVICDHVPSFDFAAFKRQYPQHADLPYADPGEGSIDILIGSDYVFHFLQPVPHLEIAPDIFIVNTVFGWMVSGVINRANNNPIATLLSAAADTQTIKQMWDLETLGIRPQENKDSEMEDLAVKQFSQNLRYENKRYEAALPWREYPPNLHNNFALAKGRLLSLLRKHAKETELLQACNAIFQQQLDEKIIEQVDNQIPDLAHYLPFHFVFSEHKSTKIRVVYDASAKISKRSNSLNECLLKGLNLTPKIPGILLRFRLNPVAITADICHAYHNIGIQEADRDFLRFLWATNVDQPDEEKKIITYRFTRAPFGCISSGFLLAETIRYHLNTCKNEYANVIQENLYIDDFITAANTINQAQEIIANSMSIFKDAGMLLHKWLTNNKELRATIDPKHQDNQKRAKILGLIWDTEMDTIQIPPPEKFSFDKPVTKRRVLQFIAKIYDPLSWLAPITITARIFLQDLHRLKLNWNDVIPPELSNQWKTIVHNLAEIENIKFQRAFTNYNHEPEFHVFTDASAKAYAAAVYVRYINSITKTPAVQLLLAKARVAPLDTVSIPRLELLAVLIGVRLLRFARDVICQKKANKSIVWSDSTCALDWIASSHNLPTFVQNRVNEIRRTPNLEFRHIKGVDNPADMPSRGISSREILAADNWWHGPSFLKLHDQQWPPIYIPSPPSADTMELHEKIKTIAIVPNKAETAVTPFGIDERKYSCYSHLLRVTAYCVFAIRKLRTQKTPFNNTTSPMEIARLLWLRHIQRQHFPVILDNLKQKRNHDNLTKQLRLFLDDNGLIRARGRFTNAPQLTDDQKYTVLLPKPSQCYVAHLIIMNIHDANFHVGTSHTLLALRKRYWIVSGRQQVYHSIRQCDPCRRERARRYRQPEQSDLPAFRFMPDRHPFSAVGLDVAGPLHIFHDKRWLLLVTCLNTRAIALEILDDMTTSTLYYAYRRIAARYTTADVFYSDNAPQFILLEQLFHRVLPESFYWKRITEHSPWEGGVYERLIATVKTTLYRTIRAQPCTSDTHLRTLIAEIEGIMNQRPLTYQTEESDLKVLTPNDFLKVRLDTPRENPEQIPSNATQAAKYLQASWEQHQQALTEVRRLWETAYLQFLRERSATQNFRQRTNTHTPKVGDIVIVSETHQKRQNWPVAIIHQLQRSTDGQVRSCVLRLPTGTKIVRPIQNVYSLELNAIDGPAQQTSSRAQRNHTPDILESSEDSETET